MQEAERLLDGNFRVNDEVGMCHVHFETCIVRTLWPKPLHSKHR